MANPFDQFDSAGPVYGAAPKVEPFAGEDQQFQRDSAARSAAAEQRAREKAERERLEWNATHNPDGSPIAKPTKDPKVTEGERASAGFYRRATNAHRAYGEGILPRNPLTQSLVDVLPDNWENALDGPTRRAAANYADEFIRAKLRKESGAAIPTEEMAREYRIYFPVPGDTKEDLARKAGLREQALEALRIQSGAEADAALSGLEGGQASANPTAPRLTPEQQNEFFSILQSQGQGPAENYLRSLGLSMVDPAQAAQPHSNALDYSPADAQVQAQIDERKAQMGGGGGAAFREGVADSVFLGAADEIRAGANAIAGAFDGQGAIGDLYSHNLQGERGYQKQLQDEHPYLYGGGQFTGGLALPGFGARSAAQFARLGAGYGVAYGFNSGEGGFGNRAAGAVTGAAAGAGLGYAIPKGIDLIPRRQPKQVPDLVDSATGRLNEPLEAAGPAARVGAAKDFGIDLPYGSAGDRTASLLERGLDIVPGSAGVMNDSRRIAEGQTQDALENVAGKFGSSRTLNEGGAELQRGAQERIARSETVTGKAYDAIPISPDARASTSASVATLQQLTGRFQSNPELAAAMKDPKLATYLTALEKGGLSWQDLKDFRTIIGEKIGDMRFGEGQSTSDLRALYAGLSEDMKATAASMGPKAIRAFERANSLYRNEQQLIEGALTRLVGKDGQLAPEKAAAAVQAMTKGGKSNGDLKALAQVKAATAKSGAWDEIAATLIRIGGQPANSPGRSFDPATFVRWYSDMAEPARAMLFKPELRKSLDQFVAVNQRLANSNALRNTSQTAPGLLAGGVISTVGVSALNPAIGAKLMAAMAGSYGMAKVWTNPKFVQWATGYSRAASTGNQSAIKSQVGRLSKLAATNPELREPLAAFIARVANDNVATQAAASQPDEDNQGQ